MPLWRKKKFHHLSDHFCFGSVKLPMYYRFKIFCIQKHSSFIVCMNHFHRMFVILNYQIFSCAPWATRSRHNWPSTATSWMVLVVVTAWLGDLPHPTMQLVGQSRRIWSRGRDLTMSHMRTLQVIWTYFLIFTHMLRGGGEEGPQSAPPPYFHRW